MATALDAILVQVDAAGFDVHGAHGFEKFSAAAAEVEDRGSVREAGHVELSVLGDVLFRASEALGEACVVEGGVGRGFDGGRNRPSYPSGALAEEVQLFVNETLLLAAGLEEFLPRIWRWSVRARPGSRRAASGRCRESSLPLATRGAGRRPADPPRCAGTASR